ncbi:hypothetical protein VE03_06497 [Pseudogymnoascus sp. 23342-1-I1]|nr:hypothetical protein VE03_06497 [Pseudogymnoascus sp. 23342-1-I1]
MSSAQTDNEWATFYFSGPFTNTKGSSRTENPSEQEDDSDILAACQTPASLTPYWQARSRGEATAHRRNSANFEMRFFDIPHAAPVSQSPGTFDVRGAPLQDRQDLDIGGGLGLGFPE